MVLLTATDSSCVAIFKSPIPYLSGLRKRFNKFPNTILLDLRVNKELLN